MSQQIALETISSPDGKVYLVSTIRTFAGGGGDNRGIFVKESDFESLTTWPFETMVFQEVSSRGLYHEAFASEAEAKAGHERIADMVRRGLEFPGLTVEGPFGNPTLTPEEWRSKQEEVRAMVAAGEL